MKVLIQKKYKDHIPCSFAYKIVFTDDGFTKPTVVYRGENDAYEFIKQLLRTISNAKK